jgi:uncharacterized protein involved in oxidation of intracellular sulfur
MNTLLILNDAPYGSERTYNGARLAGALARQPDHAGITGICSTCMEARGISADDLIPGAHRSSLDELTQWTT